MIPSVQSNEIFSRKPRRSNTNPMTIMARMYPGGPEPKRADGLMRSKPRPRDLCACD
jgi:hypothetical protein